MLESMIMKIFLQENQQMLMDEAQLAVVLLIRKYLV